MNILFRVDSSFIIGTGHIMRCCNLALQLKNSGHNIIFISQSFPGNIIPKLLPHFPVLAIPHSFDHNPTLNTNTWLGDTIDNDIDKCYHALINSSDKTFNKTFDLLIIDHYAIDSSWELAIKQKLNIKAILVIDDLHNRSHICDYLLDHSYRTSNPYLTLTPSHTKFLLGPSFCLLNPIFSQIKQLKDNINKTYDEINNEINNKINDKKIIKINISFGGGDLHDLTYTIVETIINCEQIYIKNDIQYDIVIGNLYINKNKLQTIINNHPNFHLYSDISYDQLGNLLLNTDLSIGAGGTSVYERCCLGIPSIIITVADNQICNATNLYDYGVITYLGHHDKWNKNDLISTINNYLNPNNNLLYQQSILCNLLVDGNGCHNVINAIR